MLSSEFAVLINLEDFSDLALELVERRPMLALERFDDETGLHVLARKPSGSVCQCPGYRKQLMNCCKLPQSLLVGKVKLWIVLLLAKSIVLAWIFASCHLY